MPAPAGIANPVVPAYRVAVVQSESESLHNPTRDISTMLGDRERWRYRLFTERTFEALLQAQREYDCLVVSYNAIHRNPRIGELISARPMQVGVVLMHQLRLPRGMQFGQGLSLSSETMEPGEQVIGPAEQRDPALEILLNWPQAVDITQLPAADFGFVIGADSAWRSVLEADPRRSVLARSNLDHWPPVVACSLLLEPERDQHRRLLENAVVFCSAGVPQTVVIPSLDTPWRGTLVRKLRLRRVNAVELPASSALRFGVSPLRLVADVILPRDASVQDGRDKWLSSGGRLTTVDPGTGELNVCYTAPDLQWVVRRWSAWVQKGGGDDRSTSVLAMRAFLRMLSEAERGLGKKDLRRFGLTPVADHRDEARRLLSLRLKGRSNLEATVTPTAAVLEIDDAVGGALESDQREQVRDWLVAASARVGIEDRLEIAHVIRDGDLLAESVERIPRPLSAGTLARLRTASISCARPLDLTSGAADHAAILAEIDSSLLAAAEYLSSFAGFRACATEHSWDLDALLMPGEDLLLDVAISTLTKHGVLGGDESQRKVTSEEGCAEALALARFLALDSVPTSELVKAESAPPPPFVDAVLLEGLKRREANAAVRGENAKLNQARERLQRTRARARNLLGVEVAAIAIAAAVLVALEIGAENGALNVFLGDVAVPFVVLVAVLTLLGYGLALLDLCADWLVGLGRIAKDGVEGVMGAAVGALERARQRGAEGNGERSRNGQSS